MDHSFIVPIRTWELPSRRSIQVRHVPTWPTWPCNLCRPGHFCATSAGGASPCCGALHCCPSEAQLHWLSAIAILNLSSNFPRFPQSLHDRTTSGNAFLRNMANFDHRTRNFGPVSTLKGFTPFWEAQCFVSRILCIYAYVADFISDTRSERLKIHNIWPSRERLCSDLHPICVLEGYEFVA